MTRSQMPVGFCQEGSAIAHGTPLPIAYLPSPS